MKALGQQKAEIEKARDKELYHLYDQVATEAPGILEQAASKLLAEDKGFGFIYNRDQSGLENYRSRSPLRGYFHPYLERHTPERFERVEQSYKAQLDAVDAQIATLRDYWFSPL